MLTNDARHKIFGLTFESLFCSDDLLPSLSFMDQSEKKIVMNRWQKLIRILIETGSWINHFEAQELVEAYCHLHEINRQGSELLLDIIFADQTIYLWEQEAKNNQLLEEYKTSLDENRRQEITRIAMIRAIINSYMIDTRTLQDTDMMKRLDFVFPRELKMAVEKIKYCRLPIKSMAELTELIKNEFPKLPESYLKQIPKFQNLLNGCLVVDEKPIVLPPSVSPKAPKLSSILEETEDALNDLFADTQKDIPAMHTKEQIMIIVKEPGSQKSLPDTAVKDAVYNVTLEGIQQQINEMLDDYNKDEIQDRIMDHLRTLLKHSRDCDRITSFWKILKLIESEMQKKYVPADTNFLMRKFGIAYKTVSLFKYRIGGDTALLHQFEQ